MNNYKFKFIL